MVDLRLDSDVSDAIQSGVGSGDGLAHRDANLIGGKLELRQANDAIEFSGAAFEFVQAVGAIGRLCQGG